MCRLRLPYMFIGLFLLLFLTACMPSITEPIAQAESGYPGPIPTAEEFPTEEPEPTRVEIEPTPFQTFTPRPTPTVRPGPTVTPFPTPSLPPDASGSIVYIAQDGQLMELLVDSQGEEIEAPIQIPVAYDFLPILGPASANGHLLELLQPLEPGGRPYIIDIETEEIWSLFQGHPQQEDITGWVYAWHPNNRQILFWFFNNDELLLVDTETGQYTVLALTQGAVQGATISPNGQNVAYVGRNQGVRTLWMTNISGIESIPLFESESVVYVFDWSPDGKYILYAEKSSDPIEGEVSGTPLWLFNLQDQTRKQLLGPFLFGYGFNATWSPDNQWIVYTGLDEDAVYGCLESQPDWGTCQFDGTAIYIENVESGEVHRLAAGINPTWSPDGSMIAFLSNEDGTPKLWQIRLDGTGLRQFSPDIQPIGNFVWTINRRQ